jgi:hypothetical protein
MIMRIIKILLATLFSIALASCGGGGGSATPPATPTYSISGTVSGAVVQGVTINLLGVGMNAAFPVSTTTDASGNYSFSGLQNQSYTVTPDKTGYVFSSISLAVSVSGANVVGKNFTATANTAATYSISGTVSGFAGGLVMITLSGSADGTTFTDENGNYNFSGLVNGSFTVIPSFAGNTYGTTGFSPTGTTVSVNSANVPNTNFTATYTLSGKVTGAVLQGVTINLTGAATATTTTDANGNYTISGLPVGNNYMVVPFLAGYVFSPAGSVVSVYTSMAPPNTDFYAQAAATTYSISGTVSGAISKYVIITLSGANTGSVLTDASGNYTISGLVNGSYTVTPSLAGYTFSPANSAITINSANSTANNFVSAVAPVTYSISGTVSGAVLQGVTINLTGLATANTTTNAGGNYTISGLVNGSYTVTPSLTGYKFSPANSAITINTANSTANNFTSAVAPVINTITGTVYPTVLAKSTDGSSGAVDTGAAISVTFNEAIDASTLTTSNFTVSGVNGTVAYDSSTNKASFTPSSALTYSTAYTATITTGVKDTFGNAMANSFSWSFTTKAPTSVVPYLMGGAIQGSPLTPYTNIVTTIAGIAGSLGSTDGTGLAAEFYFPVGITSDGTNLYVADTYNYTIRKVVISTGVVTTIAGTAGSLGSTDGTGSAARFSYPKGITTDGTNLYVADGYAIRKVIISTGVVTTLAGTAGSPGLTDGTGSAARFTNAQGITTDGTNLYVADGNAIRKVVISTGVVTTLAGHNLLAGICIAGPGISCSSSGSTDGTGLAATFSFPGGITTDGTNLYVADSDNNTIRKVVISTGVVTTIAGTAGSLGSTDGTGLAAKFYYPQGITTDGANLYVADSGNNTIRKVVISTGVVTTLAGTARSPGSTDGTGSAARFSIPEGTTNQGITTDGTNLYVADTGNNTIRKISAITTAPSVPPGNVTAIPGNGQITFIWDPVSGTTCYNLYCNAGTSVSTTTGTEIASVSSPYTYTGLINGTTYTCIVTACNNYGEGPPSPPIQLPPAASYTLSVSTSGTGSGTVTSSPSGCGSTCTVASGTTVTLTAAAATNSTFSGWSGACSGTGSCMVTMNSNQVVTATFTALTCLNGATNYPTCTPPTCVNGDTNYPTCTTPPTCLNGATNYPTCTTGSGDWYMHWNCNGDPNCISKFSPNGQPSGSIDYGLYGSCASVLSGLQLLVNFYGSTTATGSCTQTP